MKRVTRKFLLVVLCLGLVVNLFGCAAIKKKFMRKTKPKKIPVYYQVKEYDIKPSMELYEKHYVFWINWHKKLVEEMGESFKSDIRSVQEIRSNLEDMAANLVDEKAAELLPHIEKVKKAEDIIAKKNLTKVNETRIRHILEREYRTIKRDFTPKDMAGYIREEWK